jgi:hypothetical protein
MPPTPKITPTNIASVAQSANNRISALLPDIASTSSPITVWTTNVIYEMIALAAPPTNIYSPAYYPSSGTWTCPTGLSSVQVECWGGGGGGGGGNATSGGGGGGGGEYAAEQNYPVVPGQQYSYTCGDGGTNGISGVPGTTGQNTVFDLQGVGKSGGITAHGGQGGDITSVGKGGAGGTGSTNTTVYAGGAGGTNTNGVGDDNPYFSPVAAGTKYWYIMDDDPAYYTTIQDNTGITAAQQVNTIGTSNSTTLGNISSPVTPAQVPTSSVIGQLYQANVAWNWLSPSSTEMPYYRVNNSSLSVAGMTFSCWVYADAGGNFSGTNVSAGTIVSTFDYSITTKSPGYSVWINTSNQVNLKVSRPNGGTYSTQLLTLTTALDTNAWNYIVCSYDATSLRIYVYNGSHTSGISTTTSTSLPGTGSIVQVNSNSTYFGINPSINGPSNGFSGLMSNLWMSTSAITSTTWPNSVYNPTPTPPTTGAGGGASGGGGGVGGTGSPGSVGGAGGAGGNVPAVPATSNLTVGYTGTTGGVATGNGVNPASNSYGGGGGGAGNFSPLPTLKTMTLVAAQSASYAGPDAVSNPSSQYTFSLAPLVTNSSEKVNTSAANLSPDCYQGGQAQVDSNYQGTMSSAVLLPNATSTVTALTGATISKLTMSAEILSPNAASLILGYTNDTTLPSAFTASSVTTVTELPVPAGAQNTVVSWDLTNNPTLLTALENGTASTLIFGPGATPGDASYVNTDTASQFSVAFIGAGGVASGYLQDLTLTVQYSTNSYATAAYGCPGAVRIAYINPNGVPIASIQPLATTDAATDQFAQGFTGDIVAFHPTGATPVSPRLTETWQKPNVLSNGWAQSSPAFQYQYLPGNKVFLSGVVNPAAATNAVMFTLPAGYIPANQVNFPLSFGATGVASNVFGRVTTGGAVTVVNFTTTTGLVFFNAIIPLDLT